MRKFLLFGLMALMSGLFVACNDGKCHISGTVPENYEGKKIFLVPLFDGRAEVVDSVVIKNGKFEFTRDTLMIAKILIDYHFRLGTQPILVVVEPGEVKVRIDSVSSASGTPANDSLQAWKESKEKHDRDFMLMRKEIALLMNTDTVKANALKEKADSFHLAFKNYTRRMASNMNGNVLGDFLNGLFPRTYKRVMPDSTVVEFDADTNEPIAK
jgi:hypothetical protein